jgi:hypothetical protein
MRGNLIVRGHGRLLSGKTAAWKKVRASNQRFLKIDYSIFPTIRLCFREKRAVGVVGSQGFSFCRTNDCHFEIYGKKFLFFNQNVLGYNEFRPMLFQLLSEAGQATEAKKYFLSGHPASFCEGLKEGLTVC